MKKLLKILIVEDSEDDSILVLHHIKKSNFELYSGRVETAVGMKTALENKKWDIILSDYAMPRFSGPEALALLKETGIDIPFIVVSGTIGEEVAVEMMKAGAHDYMMKNNLHRLVPAIEREIKESENRAKRRLAEKALKASEHNYRSLAENTPDNIMRYDKECRVIYLNHNLKKILDTSLEEIANLTPTEMQPDGRYDNYEKQLKQVIATGQEVEFEIKLPDLLPKEVFHWIKMVPERNDKGEIVGALAIGRDITQRKLAEMIRLVQYKIANAVITSKNLTELFDFIKNELNSIIEAKNLFVALYNEKTGMLCSIVDKDEKDKMPVWPADKSLTGYVIQQNQPVLLRKNDIIRLHEEGIVELIGTTAEAWLGVPLKLEGKALGAIVVQSYENKDIYDQSSVEILELVAHELSIFIDWQRAEEKAIKLSRAVEQSSVSVIITNKDGFIEYVNPFFTKLTGYSIDEIIGKNPRVLNSGHHPKEFFNELWNTIFSGKDWEGEILNKKKNGDLYWEKAVISPIISSEGVITNFVAIKEDISEWKKMVEDLVVAKEKAEESDKLKTAFINNISHEIRTPLNGILGFGGFLAEMELTPIEKTEMLAHVQKSSDRLMNTVSDYMDMAMIFSGTIEMRKKVFSLQSLFEKIFENTKQLGVGKKIDFKADTPIESADFSIHSDPEIIQKIMNKFLVNAFKFTQQGTISCGYRIIPGFVEFFVQDTGKGIAHEKLEMIFEIFAQEDSSMTRGYEGSGLGLSIANGLVKLLGGTMSVTSEKGKGSIFTFTVPYCETVVAEKPVAMDDKNDIVSSKPLLLIAEDDELNYLLIVKLLEQAGCDYLLARNGLEAVELCKQHPTITLVLMDIKMPVMNGLEATKLIREFRPKLPIIAITSFAQTGDEPRFLAAGCDGYISKPFSKDKLF
ncbi:MAG: response regulator, partial [Bacteroidales bacterium]|nr:response regulator [Bacteroidales bacterium]